MTRSTPMPSDPMPSDDSAGADSGIDQDAAERWRETIRSSTIGHYHHQMGLALLGAGHDEDALIAFECAVAADPGRYSSWLRMVRLLDDQGDRERARAVLQRANARDPDAPALALAEEAEEALENGQPEEAVALMTKALAASGRAAAHRPDTVVMLAGELRNRHEDALRWCDLAAPYVEDQHDLRHQRGFSLLLLDRQDEAERELRASIAVAPERMPSWYVLGQYHRLRFEAEAALAAYGRVRKSDHPLRHWAGLMIAYTHLMEGRLWEAMDACDAVWRQEPGMKWALVMQGLVHFRAGDLDAAARAIDEGRRNFPDAFRARVFSGMLKIARDRPDDALTDFNGERGDFACLALARLGRARALLDLGAPEEAARLVHAAVKEERLWIAATLRLLGPLGDALKPLLACAGYGHPPGPAPDGTERVNSGALLCP